MDNLLKSMVGQASKYNVGGDELRVKTQFGDLVAQVGYDYNYPEIFISLKMDNGVEFTLGVIGQDGDAIRNRVKEVLGDEDFTLGVGFVKEEIEQAYNELISQ